MSLLIQPANVLCGFLLSETIIGKIEPLKEPAEKLHRALVQYETPIGVAEFVIGLVNLVNRIGFGFYVPYFTGGYPQSFAALAMGLLLADKFFMKYEWAKPAITAIQPYREYVGLAGLVIGLSAIV